ncbi:hypothetical protein FT663_05425 [Candidozyma haemuli var. vulneris]|uniref:Pyruvate decarboxylase n=1 Tax=Candidozyma haemuli TaxID=45357 RepID=A0A2V1ALP9_9ASCO|nr:hypothetical protein CXQ85_001109 [[Candida] haemuloni]KAF3984993.1 hypothetical protein FT662_05423 [[Candida] haemuloni var. vulneris]KAF3985121.1 hypothetical protein FT663_05425 [[Candida] haemuloni var. vulneris]PVH18819.1 hypothetical protein CXQ85_001109 [[Candida] haemuloni]
MSTISLGTYLFKRLHQEPFGLKSIFGVPGDFNLTLLDKIDDVDDLTWRGNVNELNGAYATDGYSRVRGNAKGEGLGFGALVTTFGVGELSAINGVAGSFAEHVGMIHIVGIPSLDSQRKQLLLHHTLGNGDFNVFSRISENVSVTHGILDDPAHAAEVVDRVIREAYIGQKPGYLAFPANMVEVKVPAERLDTPIDVSIAKNDPEAQEEVLEIILDLISKAKNPVVIVDACCARHNASAEAAKLIDVTNFKYATSPMAKGTKHINEDGDRFTGVYVGSLSYEDVKASVEESDLVLSIGAILSDFNTGAFSYALNKNTVEFHSDHTKIRNAYFPNVAMKEVLNKLIDSPKLKEATANYKPTGITKHPFEPIENIEGKEITQSWLWHRLSDFLQPDDIVITDTGTSSFGIIQTKYPRGTLGISQVLWGSIGYSVGSTFGAATAAHELDPSRRVILFVGDGSLQLTVQELSAMVRNGLTPYIFVLNNSGFTIEKYINGPEADYNNIQPWNYKLLLPAFGAQNYEALTVDNASDLDKLFKDEAFAKNDKIRLIELIIDSKDAPDNLKKQALFASQANAG